MVKKKKKTAAQLLKSMSRLNGPPRVEKLHDVHIKFYRKSNVLDHE